jgi:hypothetical protein
MKIYLSASRADLPRARHNIALLKERGHSITYDWTEHVRDGETSDAPLSLAERRHILKLETQAIERADVFWLLIPPAPSWGCLIEYGYAMRSENPGPRHVVVSGDTSASLFFDAAMGFASDGLVFDWLAGICLYASTPFLLIGAGTVPLFRPAPVRAARGKRNRNKPASR